MNDHKSYDDYVDVRGDGRIVMYKRKDHSKRPKWNVRLKLPDTKGYVVKSTRTADFDEGRRFAEDLFFKLEGKVRRGEVIRSPSFKKVAKEYLSQVDYILRDRTDQYKGFQETVIRLHLLPYFDNTPLDQISEDMMSEFVSSQFREHNLSNVTVRHHQTVMKKVFDFGRRKGYIRDIPEIPKPKLVINNRSDFSKDEWRRLYTFMRDWVEHPNSRIRRQRLYLQNYILILGNSGIRCGTETRNLKWADISSTKNLTGEERVVIRVKGKTNLRDVVCNEGIERYFKRLYEQRTEELGAPPPATECVMVNPNGKPIQSFKKSFNSLMEQVGMSLDNRGNRRTPYSIRHTYITMRLMEGVNVYQLASNAGTSIEMIENYYGHLRNRDPNVVSEITKNAFANSQSSKLDFLKS